MRYDKHLIIDCNLGRQYDVFKDNEVDYVGLTRQELNNKNNLLSGLTSKSKIILIGHGSAGSDHVSSDNAAPVQKQSVTAEEIATYIARGLDKAKITPSSILSLGQKAAKTNTSPQPAGPNGEAELKRRLTVQLCVCEAADSKPNKVSFAQRLFESLRERDIDANLVAYQTTVFSQHNKPKSPLFDPFSPVAVDSRQKLLRIFPQGSQSTRNYDLDNRRNLKIIYNRDNPLGVKYDKDWKEIYRMDVLEQLRLEIQKPAWDTRGKNFFLKNQKVPDGIIALRTLFQGHQSLDVNYDRDIHKALTLNAYEIIRGRVEKKYLITSRSEQTTDFYNRYKNALEACL